jgi:dTDP-4-dehydrorhamnose reductase
MSTIAPGATMIVLITGAGGLVASALAPRYENVIALRHAAMDIVDADAVERVFDRVGPDVVINCAVIGVDACEKNPALAERVNVDGPANVARTAARSGAAIVHFSSNYVFDGNRPRNEPYGIDDVADPINVYGKTKLAGERAVLDACGRAFVIRTSWVYGPGKDSFLSTAAAKLGRGERIQAISDTFANTTYVEDLAERVVAVEASGAYGLHQIVNEGVCSYEDFAREAAVIAGVPDRTARTLIEVVTEAEMNRPAPRPACTPMQCTPPMRPWQEALREYCTLRP